MNAEARDKTCCFTGHRADKLPWGYNETDAACVRLKSVIADAVEAAWETGYRHFICGMATGIDTYCAEAVLALRDAHPEITLEAAVPYPGQARRWPTEQRERYRRLTEACDSVTVVSEAYSSTCMRRRNRYMVDRSSLLIAVYDGQRGGTRNTVRYAESVGCTAVVFPLGGFE